ncbi:MAG: pilin [Patescibacteria group bacterium]
MKNFKKIWLASFLSIYLLAGLLLFVPTPSYAEDSIFDVDTNVNFTPQISIPDSEFKTTEKVAVGTTGINEQGNRVVSSDLLAKYINAFYKWGLSIASVISVLTLMAAGIMWIVSRGDSGMINKAKSLMAGSLTGIALLVSAWFILNTINPNLTRLPAIELETVSYKEITNDFIQNESDLPADTEIKYKCLGADMTCLDTVPPSTQLDLSICYNKFGRNFSCSGPTPQKACCAISQTITDQLNKKCEGKAEGTPCQATLTSSPNSGWCHDNKCDGEKVCCQCGEGDVLVGLYVYASCRNDLTVLQCTEWCTNGVVGSGIKLYSGGSDNYTCSGGMYSYCNKK